MEERERKRSRRSRGRKKKESGKEVRGEKEDEGGLKWIVSGVCVDFEWCWSGLGGVLQWLWGFLDWIVGVVVHACTQTL